MDTFQKKRLNCCLSHKDKNHLLKLSEFLKTNLKFQAQKKVVYISCMDSSIVPKIRKKFGIVNRKTYHPCNFNTIKEKKLLLSLFIGFIDGDGAIKKTKRNITIHCHRSWKDNLSLLSKNLSQMCNRKHYNKSYIGKDGYSFLHIGDSISIDYMLKFIKKHKIPVLNRKWDRLKGGFCR